jgi:hypothetical protein
MCLTILQTFDAAGARHGVVPYRNPTICFHSSATPSHPAPIGGRDYRNSGARRHDFTGLSPLVLSGELDRFFRIRFLRAPQRGAKFVAINFTASFSMPEASYNQRVPLLIRKYDSFGVVRAMCWTILQTFDAVGVRH